MPPVLLWRLEVGRRAIVGGNDYCDALGLGWGEGVGVRLGLGRGVGVGR